MSTPCTKTSAAAPRGRWRLSGLSLVVAAVCLLGIGVALYPQTASWFSAVQEGQLVAQYANDVKVIGPASRTQALKEAQAYNALLESGAEVKANERIPVDTGASLPSGFDYNQLLAANPYGLMGRLVIPAIKVDLPILHGTNDSTLTGGIGHLEGTSLPIGGVGTHAVLAGHRGLASATLFTNLDKVVNGDTFTIYVFGETLTYQVFDIKVVDPDQTKALNPVPGKDLVTLVTCTPIGINSQRILVTGERILPTPASAVAGAGKPPIGPGFPWWVLEIGGTILAASVYVWWSGRPVKPRRRHTQAPARPIARAVGLADA
ncbi:sortase A [Phycicoccus badiiscoriae]|uniref:Sortase A n=1 Tax=Pedococcus badiiscoriae TaxID=642776 RepID=A0A852WKL6_9MICO|nr:class C sortase [Pedococcus badiiscoriae]NYG07274.1 sortase A [Pedococcus badiiscoriae]